MRKKGTSEAVILVKSAVQAGEKNGESIYSAGITTEGEWVRFYPVAFQKLKDAQCFDQWTRISFDWHMPPGDTRPESRRVHGNSIRIIGQLPPSEHYGFLSKPGLAGVNDLAELTKKGPGKKRHTILSSSKRNCPVPKHTY